MNLVMLIMGVHRRLAELTLKARTLGGMEKLSDDEQKDLYHCLHVNLELIRRHDELTNLAKIAEQTGQRDWAVECTQDILAFERKVIQF